MSSRDRTRAQLVAVAAELLDAVVEHGFAGYMARKHPVGTDADPVEGLRAGWACSPGRDACG